jgi:NitT/TauT family transport system permease protein
MTDQALSQTAVPSDDSEVITRESFVERYRKPLLGMLAVVLFLAAWQAVYLVVPLDTLFMSKPSLILYGLWDLIITGELWRDLVVSAQPFVFGFTVAVFFGVAIGIVMGWRVRVGYALDIIFILSIFPFIFNTAAGVRAVDRLLINVVRSLGGTEKDLYLKILIPSVLPYIVAGARIGIGRGLIGVLVGEFFAASEGIGYAIAKYGDLFALDKMFACIIVIMVIAVALTEGIRWAERAAFPWRAGQ